MRSRLHDGVCHRCGEPIYAGLSLSGWRPYWDAKGKLRWQSARFCDKDCRSSAGFQPARTRQKEIT